MFSILAIVFAIILTIVFVIVHIDLIKYHSKKLAVCLFNLLQTLLGVFVAYIISRHYIGNSVTLLCHYGTVYYTCLLYTSGAGKIAKMMDDLRNNTPSKIGNWTVLEARDYKKDECVNMVTGDKHSTGLPNSNVLYYDLSDNAWCRCV